MDKKIEYYHVSADQGRLFRKFVETIGALSALVLGAQFIIRGFYPLPYIYEPMSIAAPAEVWGMAMMILAVVRGVILLVNGWWPHTHLTRKWLSAAFLFVVWLPLGACYAWAFLIDMAAGNIRTYPGLAFSIFTVGIELLVFYAHAAFVFVDNRGRHG